MKARYIVRFDDICPTMNWGVWDEVESHLIARGIRPILAVVPDNRDPALEVGTLREDFWPRVRHWQSLGWTIATHGLHHLYETRSSGLLGLNESSEFAGLGVNEQRRKLETARSIMGDNGVSSDTWIAPAHSFDEAT